MKNMEPVMASFLLLESLTLDFSTQRLELGRRYNELGLDLSLLDQGRQFHGLALKLGCDLDACVGNALVNLYAKCGTIEDANQAFDGIPMHDILLWNTLIHSYAHHGHGKEAIQAFDTMQETSLVIPNHVTLVGILSACCHVGYINKAIEYLKNMERHSGLAPSMSHYACVIDMMGRVGCLNEAFQIVNEMPFEPDSLIWKTLFGSSKVYGKLELGKFAAKEATKVSPDDPANYVLLSNLYAVGGHWEDAERTRMILDEKGLKKEPGYNWIEVKGQVCSFVAGEKSHQKTQEVYEMLEGLLQEMKEDQSKCTATGFSTVENRHKPIFFKELKKVWDKEDPNLPWEKGYYSPSNTILLDDSPYKALQNPPYTAIFPRPYSVEDINDNSLGPGGDLQVYLEGLVGVDNVQEYIEEHPFGQRPITPSNPSWPFYLQVMGLEN